MTDRPLDLDDIQGNVLGGFNTDVQVAAALTVPRPADFGPPAAWLAGLAPAITVASEVSSGRSAIKATAATDTWLCVALGRELLKGVRPDVYIRDQGFLRGMGPRASPVLGDKTDQSTWRVGPPGAPVDVLLIVAGNDVAAAEARMDALAEQAAAAGFEVRYRETLRRLEGAHEHFGFRDGISQPSIAGLDPGGTLQPGHFVFGYPRLAGGPPIGAVGDPDDVVDNGSLLVFRRLAQQVETFRSFCQGQADRIAPQWPGLTPDRVQALLVGRWPSGMPAVGPSDPGTGGDDPADAFDFRAGTPEAGACPLGAHIRKVNPRRGQTDQVEAPRILRRGIPFGPPYGVGQDEAERGLAFVAFQTSIEGQFEFLTQHWMNSGVNPAPENDLLLGRTGGPRTANLPGPAGAVAVTTPDSPSFVTPTGGAYLFAPGRKGLSKLGRAPPPAGLWSVRQLVAMASDAMRARLT